MSQEEQAKKTSQVISDAAVKEGIPAKPDKPTALPDEDLDKVAGGTLGTAFTLTVSGMPDHKYAPTNTVKK